jgi:hypothetical protein
MRIARLQSRLPLLAVLFAAILLGAPRAASADVGEKIIDLCEHVKPISGFTHADYERALRELGAGTEEYSECGQQISQAELAAARGNHGRDGSGAGTGSEASTAVVASPAEQSSITHAANSTPEAIHLGGGGAAIQPGVMHPDISAAFSSLPTPILVTLAFVLACALVLGGGLLRNRVRSRRGL